MERKEKGAAESERKKRGWMVKKLKRRGVSVRGGVCSTPPPIWRLELYTEPHTNKPNNSEFLNLKATTTSISARNLCAGLWEIESYQNPLAQMSRAGARLAHKHRKNNGAELNTPTTRDPHDQVVFGFEFCGRLCFFWICLVVLSNLKCLGFIGL